MQYNKASYMLIENSRKPSGVWRKCDDNQTVPPLLGEQFVMQR